MQDNGSSLLWMNMIQLREALVIGFFGQYRMEKLIHITVSHFFRPGFPYVDKWIIRSQYWSAESPVFTHELPGRDEKLGVWCMISSRRITGPIFCDDTFNAPWNNIVRIFFPT
jgi:hypothetical protein